MHQSLCLQGTAFWANETQSSGLPGQGAADTFPHRGYETTDADIDTTCLHTHAHIKNMQLFILKLYNDKQRDVYKYCSKKRFQV